MAISLVESIGMMAGMYLMVRKAHALNSANDSGMYYVCMYDKVYICGMCETSVTEEGEEEEGKGKGKGAKGGKEGKRRHSIKGMPSTEGQLYIHGLCHA